MTTTADDDDFTAFLRRHPPFDRMKAEDLDFLRARLRPIRFHAGEAITDPDAGPAEWFYVLRSGRITGEVRDAEIGEDERLSGNAWELVEGECFPIGALVEARPVRTSHRAETEVACLTMERAAFDDLRARSAAFGAFCSSRLAGLMQQAGRQAQAEAAQDLGGDSSLNVALSERTLRPPQTVPPETPIGDALRTMSALKIGSMVVADPEGRPIGIFTLKDLMNRVALPGLSLDAPISAVMTPDPVSLPRSAFAFEAAMAMAHAGIQHICVVEEGRLVGVISERDLFSMQRVGLVNLSKSITAAASVGDLARLAGSIHQLVAQMLAQGAKVSQITQIITLLNDQIGVRIIDLTLAEAGGAPIPFTWVAFGSEGRQEQTLKTDQDNGILFDPPPGMSPDAARALLLPIAGRINVALDACGFTLCPGNIMARNPECCLSGDEWRARFGRWIDQGTPEHLLAASIYFDARRIWGPEAPLADLRGFILDKAAANSRFRRQMAANALRNTPPLGMLRDFRLSGAGDEAHTLDLKTGGVTPFIDAARIFALTARIPATNTLERLAAAARDGGVPAGDVATWTEAYDYIRLLRMRINKDQAAAGRPLSNRVAPDALNDLDRRILREAFREARRVQQRLALDYQI